MVCPDKNKSCVRMSILHPVLSNTLTSGDHSQGQVSVKFLIDISIQVGSYMLVAKHFITQTTLFQRRGWDFLV